MPVTNVKAKWVAGRLEFRDLSENILFVLDGTAKAIDMTLAKIDVSGGSSEIALGALQVGSSVMRADAVGSSVVADEALDGQHAANVADNDAAPGLMVVLHIAAGGASTNGALGSTIFTDVTITEKIRIHDVIFNLTTSGSAADVANVSSTVGIITNSVDVSGADKAIVRAATLDDARVVIASGEKIRVGQTAGTTSVRSASLDVLIIASKSA